MFLPFKMALHIDTVHCPTIKCTVTYTARHPAWYMIVDNPLAYISRAALVPANRLELDALK